MADPDPEHEAPRVGGVDAVERLGDGLGGRRPDVNDPGGHLERGSRLQKWFDEGQFGRWRAADPNCEVAEPAEVDCFRCSHCHCNPRIPGTYSATAGCLRAAPEPWLREWPGMPSCSGVALRITYSSALLIGCGSRPNKYWIKALRMGC